MSVSYRGLLVAAWFPLACYGEDLVLEILPLKHRLVAEVISVVQPLVVPDGTVTGMNNQLIVRTTPANLAEIKKVLSSLDQAPRRLRISVRQDAHGSANTNEHALSGSYRSGKLSAQVPDAGVSPEGASLSHRGVGIGYRAYSTDADTDASNVHFIQGLEGQAAFIQTGQSVPLTERTLTYGGGGYGVQDSTQYRDVTSGFYVLPRLNGDRVTLVISPQASRLDPGGSGAINVQAAETTVSGRLGSWIDLGGLTENYADDSGLYLTRTRRQASEIRRIWVKVDEIP